MSGEPTDVQLDASSPMLTVAERSALADDLEVFIRLHDHEADSELLATLRQTLPADWFALKLHGELFESAQALVVDGLAAIPEPVGSGDLNDMAAEFAAIYLTYAYQAAPTESVWRDEDHLERQEAMFAVRRWYAKYGVAAPNWRIRSDDHIVNELQFLGLLLLRAEDAAGLRDVALFLRDHLLVWVPEFAKRVALRCRLPFYAGACLMTSVYLEHLAELVGAYTGIDMTPPELLLKPAGFSDDGVPSCGSPRPISPRQAVSRQKGVLFERSSGAAKPGSD